MQGASKIEKLLVIVTYPDDETTKINVALVGEGEKTPETPERAEVWDIVPMVEEMGFRLLAIPKDAVDFFG